MRNCRSSLRPWISMVLLFSCNYIYSQFLPENDSLKKIPSDIINKIKNDITVSSDESFHNNTISSISVQIHQKDKNLIFFDTLIARASKNLLTRSLCNFIIINTDTTNRKHFTGTSEESYIKYSGKRIRKIVVQRLNVFGADINNPSSYNPKKSESLLNKTHFNTNENIIRKNLLFSVGDNITPLLLSDNERILRQLPYIDDARITVVPVSDEEADILVVTKDVYSLGASFSYGGINKGSLSVFDKNIFGLGHELGVQIPYNGKLPDSPGFGANYTVNNIAKSFINGKAYYLNGLGERTYGINLNRKLVSATTKWAGGASVMMMYTTSVLDTLPAPEPLKYNLQDYWLSRSFLINKESVSRIIIGARYTNNNVFDHPVISAESYYNLQKYQLYLGSAALSFQKYTKANLIYSYGRTEDIPYGALLKFTAGREFNEYKQRTYLGGEVSFSLMPKSIGYIYTYAGLGGYLCKNQTEQGLLSLGMNYFSNLLILGSSKVRNFIYVKYTNGFGRYSNEYLRFTNDNGFTGFKNDSVNGNQRLSVSLESVLFSPINLYGFKFAFFGFTDFSFLSGTNEMLGRGYALSSIGVGVRIRNDNLVFNTLQIRISYFPNPPGYSSITPVTISGEQLLQPPNFDPGPPAVIPYR